MLDDLIFIALVLLFFAIAFWYVRFCQRVQHVVAMDKPVEKAGKTAER